MATTETAMAMMISANARAQHNSKQEQQRGDAGWKGEGSQVVLEDAGKVHLQRGGDDNDDSGDSAE